MCKIFFDESLNDKTDHGEIVTFGLYHKYWISKGVRNPLAENDMISKRILDVKDGKEEGIAFFYNNIDSMIRKDVTICVVPSHESAKVNKSGIATLARRLAKNGRVDKVDFLLRGETIDKLAFGGTRSAEVQRNSLVVNSDMKIEKDVVLLVDDVTTSGISLEVCREILLENGAENVAMFALGKSV